jgi:hypothetical protein
MLRDASCSLFSYSPPRAWHGHSAEEEREAQEAPTNAPDDESDAPAPSASNAAGTPSTKPAMHLPSNAIARRATVTAGEDFKNLARIRRARRVTELSALAKLARSDARVH